MCIGLLICACARNEQGTPLAHSDKATVRQELDSKTERNGQRVAVEGYLFLPGENAEEEDGTVGLALYTRPSGQGDRLLDLKVRAGRGPNQVWLATAGKGKTAGYKITSYEIDLKQSQLTTADGVAHDLKTRVKVSGTVKYVSLFSGGFSHQEDPLHKGVQLYPFSLEAVRLDPS